MQTLLRYPDPAIQVVDPSFNKYRINSAAVERLATGFRWCEGPAWFGDGRYLVWSDIPNNRIMRWDGKPLNSPNDVVVKSDDSVWFSDPPFGILGHYEGHLATPELSTNVYRV